MSSDGRSRPGGAGACAVRLDGVSKVYDRAFAGIRWRAAVPGLPQRAVRPLVALDSLDLSVAPGESLALIGPNGAGKSTVLKVVAGITSATAGAVTVNGDVASMIELGVGFHEELTGNENIRSSLVLRGRTPRQIEGLLPSVAEFAGIDDALDTPLKRYSLGMRARLAFAVATHAPADILVIDEVLAVGDREFQQRCVDRIREMVAAGSTLLFVSHEMALVAQVCARAVQLRSGRIIDDGPALAVIERYRAGTPSEFAAAPDSAARIDRLDVPTHHRPWDRIELAAEVTIAESLDHPAVGVDLSVPFVSPMVIGSAVTDLPGLGVPGRYALRGLTTPIPGANATFRATMSIVDGGTRRLHALATADTAFAGDDRTGVPRLAIEPHWSSERVDPSATDTPTRSYSRVVGPHAVEARGLVKTFDRGRRRSHLADSVPVGGRVDRDIVALDDVTLDVGVGEALGIIGPNGAGKSTLLRVLAGLVRVDSGSWSVSGRAVPMLDLGTALHPELTGLENILVVAQLLGSTRAEAIAARDAVVEFAGIGDAAMAAPVKQYSSGMRARLGFAIAVAAPGEVLLIDEALAVGDEDFRRQAIEAIAERRAAGATILFVSHELRLVEQVCDRVVRLEQGRVADDGAASRIIDAYGGASWAGGSSNSTVGIRLEPFTMPQRQVPTGGSIEFEGTIVVERPDPTARLELSYRAVPEDRLVPVTLGERDEVSLFLRTVEPVGGLLAGAGTYRYRCHLERNAFAGDVDVVVSAIDDRDNVLLAEVWQTIRVGEPGPTGIPGPVLGAEWTVERIGEA